MALVLLVVWGFAEGGIVFRLLFLALLVFLIVCMIRSLRVWTLSYNSHTLEWNTTTKKRAYLSVYPRLNLIQLSLTLIAQTQAHITSQAHIKLSAHWVSHWINKNTDDMGGLKQKRQIFFSKSVGIDKEIKGLSNWRPGRGPKPVVNNIKLLTNNLRLPVRGFYSLSLFALLMI